MYKLVAIRDENQSIRNMEEKTKKPTDIALQESNSKTDTIDDSLLKLLVSGAVNNKEELLLPLLAVIQKTTDKKEKVQLQRLYDHLISVYTDSNESQMYMQYETYDEYYEDIDQELKENNRHFFDEGLETDQCQGIMDEDDLHDYDMILLRAF